MAVYCLLASRLFITLFFFSVTLAKVLKHFLRAQKRQYCVVVNIWFRSRSIFMQWTAFPKNQIKGSACLFWLQSKVQLLNFLLYTGKGVNEKKLINYSMFPLKV